MSRHSANDPGHYDPRSFRMSEDERMGVISSATLLALAQQIEVGYESIREVVEFAGDLLRLLELIHTAQDLGLPTSVYASDDEPNNPWRKAIERLDTLANFDDPTVQPKSEHDGVVRAYARLCLEIGESLSQHHH